jgi:hypothetical protein
MIKLDTIRYLLSLNGKEKKRRPSRKEAGALERVNYRTYSGAPN